MALAAYERTIASRRLVPVLFRLRHAVQPGQLVKVVGGHQSLGEGTAQLALELKPMLGWLVFVGRST